MGLFFVLSVASVVGGLGLSCVEHHGGKVSPVGKCYNGFGASVKVEALAIERHYVAWLQLRQQKRSRLDSLRGVHLGRVDAEDTDGRVKADAKAQVDLSAECVAVVNLLHHGRALP